MDMKLRPAPVKSSDGVDVTGETVMNRRQFLRYGFNAAAGVLTASLGTLGFASIPMPPSAGSEGNLSVLYWAKGREDDAWYGPKHSNSMLKSDFEAEAAKIPDWRSGSTRSLNESLVCVTYVPHSKNAGKPLVNNVPRFQMTEGVDVTGKIVGHFEDLSDADPTIFPSDDIVMAFIAAPTFAVLPGWQLVANDYTEDTWTPGTGDDKVANCSVFVTPVDLIQPCSKTNSNTNRSNGQKFNYAGIARSGGPAPMGLPLIPVSVTDDVIEGMTTAQIANILYQRR